MEGSSAPADPQAPIDLPRLYEETRLDMGRAVGKRLRRKPFQVHLRPYAGLSAVIRDKGNHFDVRLSDILTEAPADVHAALAKDLLARLDRRLRVSRRDLEPYDRWVAAPHVQAAHEASRRARGRKRMLPPRGEAHDLDVIFDRLNATYFEGSLPRPRIGWSPQRSRGLYGHHDPVHNAVVVNRLLDHPRVPNVVVASVVYHEMLHIRHGIGRAANGRHVYHSAQFRADERRFGGLALANAFLRRLERGKVRLRPRKPLLRAPALVAPPAPPSAPPQAPPGATPQTPQPQPVTQTTLLSDTW